VRNVEADAPSCNAALLRAPAFIFEAPEFRTRVSAICALCLELLEARRQLRKPERLRGDARATPALREERRTFVRL
jgi:hypothetical protein